MLKFTQINRSWLAAGVVSVALAVYLLSADVSDINGTHKELVTEHEAEQSEILPQVTAEQFASTFIPRTLTLYGRTGPDRVVTVSAELPAQVTRISASRGMLIGKGSEILRLREGYIPAELKFAQARVRQTRLDYESAQSLQSKNLIAENQLPQLEVALAEAQSQLKRLEIDLANTRIEAPISGVLNARMVELGDFIDKGNPVAELLDLDPLIVSVDVPQNSIQTFAIGDSAAVRFLDGREIPAQVRYISRKANDATRTFSVELAFPNPDMTIPAGLSVEADLLMDKVLAIKVSPALLALNEQGVPGIKWVDTEDVVHFTEVDVVKTDSNNVWLTGIPEQARIITLGQGFVRVGDRVLVSVKDSKLLAGE